MEYSGNLPKANSQRFFISLGSIALGGFLTGAVVSIISNFIYLIVLFPIGMAFAAAMIVENTIRTNKIRNLMLGTAFGVLAGIVIYGTFHFGNYLSFRIQSLNILDKKLVEQYGKSDLGVSNQLVDLYLVNETGYSNLLGYILLEAKQGISIGHLFGGNYTNIGTFFTWIYWLLEFGMITGLGIIMGKEATCQPFCEVHDRWYDKEQHLGGAGIIKAKDILTFLEQKDFANLGSILEENADMPSIEVYIQSCDNCVSSSIWLSVKQASLGQKGAVQLKNILRTTITPAQRNELVHWLSYIKMST